MDISRAKHELFDRPICRAAILQKTVSTRFPQSGQPDKDAQTIQERPI
jgi:hypothetical protein